MLTMDRPSGQMTMQSSVIIRTVHDYTPDGRDKIINSYRQESRFSAAVDCTFDPIHQSFRLKGESQSIEMAFRDFMRILEENVQSESNPRKPSRLLHRNVFTLLNAPAVPWFDDPKLHGGRQMPDHLKHAKFPDSNPSQALALMDTGSPMFPIVRYWTPKVSREDFSRLLDLNRRPSKAEALSKEGKCEVIPDWVKRQVRIAAHDQEVVNTLLRKLDKIEHIFKSGFKPHETYLVHVEDVAKFQFRLVALSKQNDRVQRTLFEFDSKWISHPIQRMHTVRLMEYKPIPQKYMNYKVDCHQIPRISGHDSGDWSQYLYVRRETQWTPRAPGNAQSRALLPLENMNPLRDIEPEDLLTQFYSGASTRAVSDADVSTSQAVPTSGRHTATARQPKARAMLSGHHDTDTSISGPGFMGPSSFTHHSEEGIGETPAGYHLPGFLDFGSRPPTVCGDEEADPGFTTRKPKERKRVGAVTDGSRLDSRPASQISRARDTSTRSSSRAASETSGTIVTGSYLNSDRNFHGPAGDMSIDLGARPTDDIPAPAEFRTTRKPKAKKQKKAIKDGDNDIVETLSGLSLGEPSTRNTMDTMRQKAPSRAPQAIQKDSDRLRRMNNLKVNNDFSKALEYIRSWRGDVTLQAKLGRLLFINLGRDATRDALEYTGWEIFANDEVKKAHSVFTHFTPALTRDDNDIEYILGLDVAGGTEALFDTALPPTKTVAYEFHCVDAGEPCLMVIDAHNFRPVVYSEKQHFGSTYIANPKHTWDSCIELSGREILPITASLDTIVQSLSASGDNTPILTFFIAAQDLIVNKVICKRETRYPLQAQSVIKGVPMELVITEVQHLQLGERKVNGSAQYRALGRDRGFMKGSGRLWYTVAITPIGAKELFQDNQCLEIGEETRWSTEAFIGQGKNSVFTTLTTAVNAVLRKIDNVGYGNVRAV